MEKNIKKVTIIENLGYGLGNLGFGVVFQTLSTYLLFYSTAVLGLSGAVVGSILAVGVFWDALTDPLVGYLSDITYSKKWGRRHLYMLIGAIAVSILNYKLWNINSSALSNEKLIAITIYILLIKTFLTLYGTPYTALGGEITEDYEERTWIQSYKTVFFMLGLSFPTVAGMLLFFVPTAEYPVGQLNPMAYTDMSVFVSILMLVTSLIAIVATKSYIPNTLKGYNEEDKDRSILKSFKLALKNKYFIHIFVGYLAVNIASALLSSVGMHVFTYTFEESNTEIALTMGMFFLWSIISLPVWLKVGKKIEKQEVMIWH